MEKKMEAGILFGNAGRDKIIQSFCALAGGEGKEDTFSFLVSSLTQLGETYGFKGDLWHHYLALWMAGQENPYSLSLEGGGRAGESVLKLAAHDCALLWELFFTSLSVHPEIWSVLKNYSPGKRQSFWGDASFHERIAVFAKDLEHTKSPGDFQEVLGRFYQSFGAGKLGQYRAFTLLGEGEDWDFIPILPVDPCRLSDVIGYESQKQKLRENTLAFLQGAPANNCLLFGDGGTGKSTSIKSLVNEYFSQGLRVIEVYKHQFPLLPSLLSRLAGRNLKFLIFMDDLSFEEGEQEYKYLKSLLEGGFGARPRNVLVYATSNRRHLIRESFRDKQERDEELHRGETVQEKLSLAARFGLRIYYPSPQQKQFQEIVLGLAKRHHIAMEESELLFLANQWELSHGGLSGRTARQFVTYLQGRKSL